MVAGAAFVAGLSGPVGSAGAGVPAALHGPGSGAHVRGATSKAAPAVTKDRLGTRRAVLFTSPFNGLAQRMSGTSYCGTPTAFGPSSQSQLGANWTELIARSYACRSAPATGSWTAGVKFTVTSRGAGELVCRSQASGEATNIWYKTSKGWVWSGGAVNPVWNTTC